MILSLFIYPNNHGGAFSLAGPAPPFFPFADNTKRKRHRVHLNFSAHSTAVSPIVRASLAR